MADLCSPGRSAARDHLSLADASMDRLLADDRDVHPDSALLDRGEYPTTRLLAYRQS